MKAAACSGHGCRCGPGTRPWAHCYVFDFNTLLPPGQALLRPGLFPGGPRRVSRDGRPAVCYTEIYRPGPLSTPRNREAAMKLFATHAPRAGWAGPRHALPECAALRNSAFVPLCTFTQRAGAIRFTRRAGAAAGFGSKAGKRTVFARFQTTAAVQAAPEHKRGATCNQNSISSIFTPITTRTAA